MAGLSEISLRSPLPDVHRLLNAASGCLSRQAAPAQMVADCVRAIDRVSAANDVYRIWRSGRLAALIDNTALGHGLAFVVSEIARTGRWSYLEWLIGAPSLDNELQHVPGIGEGLAVSLRDVLGTWSLEQFYFACLSGRMDSATAIGSHRRRQFVSFLERYFGQPELEFSGHSAPSEDFVLLVEKEFRNRLKTGRPRSTVPEGEPRERASVSVPILHSLHGAWRCTTRIASHDAPEETIVGLHRGDFLLHNYRIASDPNSGQRYIVHALNHRGVPAQQL